MKKIAILLMGCAAWISCAASAQSWNLFVPAERDFRVLMPAPPSRGSTPDGSVEFRADTGQLQYSVLRHDPRRADNLTQARADIVQRLSAGGDMSVRSMGQDDGDLAPDEFIFRVGGVWTMHKVIVESGRYYEMVVRAPADEGLGRQTARDFFQSFQMGRAGSYASMFNVPAPETCQGRSNAFSRRFCEYLTCLLPDYQAHPVCTSLPPLLRN